MKVTTREKGKYTIIGFSDLREKQLDLTNIKQIREKFNYLISKNKNFIGIDFKNVEYFDSSVVGFIVEAYNYLTNNNGDLVLLNLRKNLIEILEMTNLTNFLKINVNL